MDEGHIAEWPDKILFAGMTLVMGALLAIFFEIGRIADITIDVEWLAFLDDYPSWLVIAFNGISLLFGALAIKHQAWIPAFISAMFGFLGLGALLITPLLALVAIGFMIRAKIEGEECTWDEYVLDGYLWPDKAIAASMLLGVGGLITIIHGIYLAGGEMDTLYGSGATQGSISILLGLAILVGARETFHLRKPLAGNLAAVACFLGAGFYFLGPVLGIFAFMLIGMAEKEEEFTQ